jgi:hypothetical protein
MKHATGARRVCLLFLLTAGVAAAQVYPGGYPPGGYPGGYPPGGYPPGGYPPGGYPPGYPGGYPGGAGIPLPGGKTSKSKGETAKGPLPNFRGTLRQMDAKQITLVLGDDRQLLFKRNDKTKFFKGGDEVKSPKFNEGDQISIEGPEDAAGNMIAVNVYWEKAAAHPGTETASKAGGKNDDGATVDTWKDAPPKEGVKPEAKAAAPAESAGEAPMPPPSVDPSDPGRPRLQRGKPSDPSREHAKEPPVEQAAATPPPSITRDAANPAGVLPPPNTSDAPLPVIRDKRDDDEAPRAIVRQGDDLIRKATDAALDFTETLPNYVCTEQIARYQTDGGAHPNWQAIDLISAEVVYEKHQESYRNLTRNGRRIDKKMEQLDGAWSTGEFGTILIDLFSPATAANFRYQKESRSAGVPAKVYTYDVDHQHSHWNISVGGQSYQPAYKGSVWIDPATARVLRIEMQAYGFPEEFPDDHVESATDYEYTRLGDAKQYLLPVHSENLACQRGSNMCSRNAIDFRNYHKYTGESTITFGKDK